MRKFNGFEEVEDIIQNQNRNLVVYKNNVYDLTEFKLQHPGGEDIIEDYTGYDIEEAFTSKKIHQHSQNAHNILQGLKIGFIDYGSENQMINNNKINNNNLDKNNQQQQQQKNQVGNIFEVNLDEGENLPQMRKNVLDYKDFKIYLNIPIAQQVLDLTSLEYKTMLQYPCKDEQVPYSFTGIQVTDRRFLVSAFMIGINKPILRYAHFVLFGRHMLFPNKPLITGYSPLFIGVVFMILNFILSFIMPDTGVVKIIILGCQIVLLVQEYIHFKFHTDRFKSEYLSIKQSEHIGHHEKLYQCNYGILTDIWDKIFKTSFENQ
ncbi:Cytochrome b5-like heme/steroid binding domain [Pseudocohnilembus persalinus]|uniref:Cytochrome b5-like heme/steroid binding domain n=1 Tax=Pseudocohnilembus persalinus TaxID=266149 RepID=A0A0V0QLL1_PSEPJ|nr:Cytochrome b5-like heme/steroid binding domain [Pseudocohnilembus persalinus]|eukprot:KRX03147.1 Cytochrome b5-like heme/steroid binding domain [Pseudocohnilembus persalinus]